LSDLNGIYYVEYDKRHEHKRLARFVKQHDKEVFAVSASVAKKLEKTGRGQHANNFLKDYKLTKEVIETVINRVNHGSGLESFVRKGIKFKGYQAVVQPKYQVNDIPESIVERVKKLKVYTDYVAKVNSNNELRKKLPLLDNITGYDINKEALQEYVDWKLS
jgi:ribosome-binding ATPase YchF (GTP1/OBG family)